MSWKTRKKGTVRQKGKRFKTKTRYWRPKYYRKPFSLTDQQEAQKKVEELQRAFKYGYTRKRRKAIKMALVSAANKALASGNPEVAEIYRKGYENMSLEKTMVPRHSQPTGYDPMKVKRMEAKIKNNLHREVYVDIRGKGKTVAVIDKIEHGETISCSEIVKNPDSYKNLIHKNFNENIIIINNLSNYNGK